MSQYFITLLSKITQYKVRYEIFNLILCIMEIRNYSRSLDHVNWWEPEHWKSKGPRSVSSVSLERDGWLPIDYQVC